MIVAATTFLLIFGVMNIAYLFFHRYADRSATRLQTERLTSREEPEPSPGSKVGALLLRRERTGTAVTGYARACASRFQADERLGRLMESAGIYRSRASFIRRCAMMASGGGILFLCFAPHSLAWLALPLSVLSGGLPVLGLPDAKRGGGCRLSRPSFRKASNLFRVPCGPAMPFQYLWRCCAKNSTIPWRGRFAAYLRNRTWACRWRLPSPDSRSGFLRWMFSSSPRRYSCRAGPAPGISRRSSTKLAQLIRERYKLQGKIKAVSAHGRMTGKVLCAIPMFVGGLMFFVNRDYAEFFLRTVLGREMIAGALGLQLLGYLVIQKIVNIETDKCGSWWSASRRFFSHSELASLQAVTAVAVRMRRPSIVFGLVRDVPGSRCGRGAGFSWASRIPRSVGELVQKGRGREQLKRDFVRAGIHSPNAEAIFNGMRVIAAIGGLRALVARRDGSCATPTRLTTIMGALGRMRRRVPAARRESLKAPISAFAATESQRHCPNALDLPDDRRGGGAALGSIRRLCTSRGN